MSTLHYTPPAIVTMSSLKFTSVFAALCVLATSQARSLNEALADNDELSTVAGIVETSGLGDLLQEQGDVYTILAPTDGAFAALMGSDNPPDLTDPTLLTSLLQYHTIKVPGLMSSDVATGSGDFLGTWLDNGTVDLLDGTPQVVNLVRDGSTVTVYSGGKAAADVVGAVSIFNGRRKGSPIFRYSDIPRLTHHISPGHHV